MMTPLSQDQSRYRCATVVTVAMILLLVLVSMWLGWMLRAWWQA